MVLAGCMGKAGEAGADDAGSSSEEQQGGESGLHASCVAVHRAVRSLEELIDKFCAKKEWVLVEALLRVVSATMRVSRSNQASLCVDFVFTPVPMCLPDLPAVQQWVHSDLKEEHAKWASDFCGNTKVTRAAVVKLGVGLLCKLSQVGEHTAATPRQATGEG